jgi:outer membrane protein assembly factor BamD
MLRFSIKTCRFFVAALAILLLAGSFGAGAFAHQKKDKVKIIKVKPKPAPKAEDAGASAEPDKLLYQRAVNNVEHRNYIEGRLAFQTLINTYPDSEYLAKAELGLADSYYKEGGVSNLTQAIQQYKDFIVFFPFLDEAAYAQMQVGMAHYRMMEKSDRDASQVQAAEDEFQAFLLKYPQSPLVPQVDQRLREVQEVLADGDFRVARFYYIKRDYRASAARCMEVCERYPLYSRSDEALFMLGDIYLRAKQVSRDEDDKNHWADLAAQSYARIVRDYPLSRLAPEAKARLKTLEMPIPSADPRALARMQIDQKYEKQHHPNFLLKFPMEMIKSSPDVYAAAHSGKPNLNPPDDSFSATEVLKRGSPGLSSTVAAVGIQTGGGGGAAGNSPPVETESSESSVSTPTTNADAQITEAPATGATNVSPSTLSSVPSDSTAPSATTANSAATSVPPDSSTTTATSAAPSPDQSSAPQAAQNATESNSQAGGQQVAGKNDAKRESTSKKKKGFHKLVPW